MNPDQDYEFLIKLLIIGDSTVGKTNFVSKFIESKFNENYFASTGIDLKKTSIKIDGKNIKLQIWDTAGQEKYRSMTKNLFLKSQGIIAIYDITNESSFNNLKNWMTLIQEECNIGIPIIIVGNKIDLENKRVISKEKAMEFAKSQNIDYIETSSKTGENIDKTIKMITEKVIQKADSVSNLSFALDSGSFNKRKFHSCC